MRHNCHLTQLKFLGVISRNGTLHKIMLQITPNAKLMLRRTSVFFFN
jgi:hypothetical protein